MNANTKMIVIHLFTKCPGRLDPFYIVCYDIKWVKTSWAYSILVGTTSEKQIVTTDLHHKCTTKHTGQFLTAKVCPSVHMSVCR